MLRRHTANVVTIKAWRSGELPDETRSSYIAIAGAGGPTPLHVIPNYPLAAFFTSSATWARSPEELEAWPALPRGNYEVDSYIGKTGIELTYEDELAALTDTMCTFTEQLKNTTPHCGAKDEMTSG